MIYYFPIQLHCIENLQSYSLKNEMCTTIQEENVEAAPL